MNQISITKFIRDGLNFEYYLFIKYATSKYSESHRQDIHLRRRIIH